MFSERWYAKARIAAMTAMISKIVRRLTWNSLLVASIADVFYPRTKKPRQIAPAGPHGYAATFAGIAVSNSSAKLQTWPVSLAAIAGVERRWKLG